MTGAIFVRDGLAGINQLSDLRGKKVLGHQDSLGEALLRRSGLAGSIVLADSVEQGFTLLEQG